MALLQPIRTTRISSKLLRVVFLIIIAFATIVAIVAWSVSRVGDLATDESVAKLREISRTSETARELSAIFSGIELVRRTFYEQDHILKNDGERLRRDLQRAVEQTPDSRLKDSLSTLFEELKLFLAQCAKVNRQLALCRTIDQQAHQELNALEKLISMRLVEQAKYGGDKLYLEQILGLITGYRESLLTVGKLHAEQLGLSKEDADHLENRAIMGHLDDLSLRLQTISSVNSEVGQHGRRLLQDVTRYHCAEADLHEARNALDQRFVGLRAAQGSSLAILHEISQRNLKATSAVTGTIKDIVVSTLIYVICVALLVIGLTSWLTLRIIHHNINRPLQQVLADIETIGKDQIRSALPIPRDDEWGTIDLALRNMHEKLACSIAALKESEERYSSIFAHIGVGIALISPRMEIISLNPVMRKWFPHIDPGQRPICYQAFNSPPAVTVCPYCPSILTLQDGEVHVATSETPTPEGICNYRIVSTPLKAEDGSVSAVIEVVEDITEAVSAEQAIRRNEEFVRNIIDNVDEGFLVFGPDLRVMACNRTFCDWFGLSRQDAMSKTAQEITAKYLSPGNFSKEISVRDVFASGEAQTTMLTLNVVDGGVRYLDIKLFPLMNTTGTVTSVIETIRDITERHLFVAEQQKLKEAADVASQAKSAFLANMSHEIRTPLNAIIGLSHLLQQTSLSGVQQDFLTNLEQSARLLLRIIQDVLDISRIEAGKLFLEQTDFRLRESLERVLTIMHSTMQDKDLALHLSFGPDIPELLRGDPLRLEQILVNLVGNAVKFTERGEVKVTVARLDSGVDTEVKLAFSVHDSGIGLAPEQIADLFRPFTQGDSTTTRRFGGSGLGLSIVKRLVELMQGEIAVESAPGAGSTFTFTARFQPAAAPALPVQQSAMDFRTISGARALVVEDNQINLMIVRLLLGQAGLQVTTAVNGREAVTAVTEATEPFDVVLMDIQMPEMDGYEATRLIRRQWPQERLPVIAMTAHALAEDVQRCRDAGMNDHLSKPVDIRVLHDKLSAWVRPGAQSSPEQDPVSVVAGTAIPPMALPPLSGLCPEDALTRLNISWASYRELILQFGREHQDDAVLIRKHLETGNQETARIMAHTLKGVAGNLAASRLAQIAAAVESALKENNAVEATSLLATLEAALAEVVASAAVLSRDEAAASMVSRQSINAETLAPRMQELSRLLAMRDLGALEIFAAVKPALELTEPPQAAALTRAIEQLDFATALGILQELAVGYTLDHHRQAAADLTTEEGAC